MKRIVLSGVLCSVLFAYEGNAQKLGFGFEFFNQPNMMSALVSEDYGEGSLSDLFAIVAPTILCDINLGNVLKIEPQLGVLVGDGTGDNAMFFNGGLGVFGLHDPMDEILIYYGGRGGVRPWVTAVRSTPETYWFATANIGGELIIVEHLSVGLEAGLGYNFLQGGGGLFAVDDRHFLSTETRILLRFYVM